MICPEVSDSDRTTVSGLSVLPDVGINLRDELIPYYVGILPQLCEHRDEPDTHGETAYIDANVLELLNERMNLGRYVAVSKIQDNPDVWNIVPNTSELAEALRDRVREELVIEDALRRAERFGLVRHGMDSERRDFIQGFFRWIIDRTLDLEVEYLQGLHSLKT